MLLISLAIAAFALAPLRPPQPTTITRAELPAILASAHVEALGSAPSAARLRMATAQVTFEGLGLPGRNLGGIDAVDGQPVVRWRGVRLRAHDSYAEAGRAFWELLQARCRWALAAFDTGDALEASRRLALCGYHRTPVDAYAAGLRGCMGR